MKARQLSDAIARARVLLVHRAGERNFNLFLKCGEASAWTHLPSRPVTERHQHGGFVTDHVGIDLVRTPMSSSPGHRHVRTTMRLHAPLIAGRGWGKELAIR